MIFDSVDALSCWVLLFREKLTVLHTCTRGLEFGELNFQLEESRNLVPSFFDTIKPG
jgi:hypothetical protein